MSSTTNAMKTDSTPKPRATGAAAALQLMSDNKRTRPLHATGAEPEPGPTLETLMLKAATMLRQAEDFTRVSSMLQYLAQKTLMGAAVRARQPTRPMPEPPSADDVLNPLNRSVLAQRCRDAARMLEALAKSLDDQKPVDSSTQ